MMYVGYYFLGILSREGFFPPRKAEDVFRSDFETFLRALGFLRASPPFFRTKWRKEKVFNLNKMAGNGTISVLFIYFFLFFILFICLVLADILAIISGIQNIL